MKQKGGWFYLFGGGGGGGLGGGEQLMPAFAQVHPALVELIIRTMNKISLNK